MVNTGIRKQGWTVVLILAVAFLVVRFTTPLPRQEEIFLDVGGSTLKVKVADTPHELQKGLSGIPFLKENDGMLFVFPKGSQPAFHMKNVSIPLSIAFMDQYGLILKIEDMDPEKKELLFPPPEGSRYALEGHRGWFQKHKIKGGDLVQPQFHPLVKRRKLTMTEPNK